MWELNFVEISERLSCLFFDGKLSVKLNFLPKEISENILCVALFNMLKVNVKIKKDWVEEKMYSGVEIGTFEASFKVIENVLGFLWQRKNIFNEFSVFYVK